jgi:hypothetical protein
VQMQSQLNFHHNFTEPVRIGDSHLFYDPVRVDRILTEILLEKEERREVTRSASTAWR